MRRTLAALTATAALVLGGAVAAPAASAASDRSVHNYCPTDPDSPHPGNHNGWEKQKDKGTGGNERRNVGGTCPVDPPPTAP